MALSTTDVQRHQGQNGDLSREGLGGGDANFGACVGVRASMRLTGNGRTHHVAHAKDSGTRLFGHFDGGQGICRFTGLRNRDDDVFVGDNGVAVAEFGGVFDFDRNSGQIFQEVFTHQTGVPRGATANDENALRVEQRLGNRVQSRHFYDARLEVDAAANGIANALRLFKNFFQHEVLVAPFFDAVQIQLQLVNRGVDRKVRRNFTYLNTLAAQNGHFAILEVDHFLGAVQEWSGV